MAQAITLAADGDRRGVEDEERRVVAVSPVTVYRVLRTAGLLYRWNRTPSRKGTGFVQSRRPHEH